MRKVKIFKITSLDLDRQEKRGGGTVIKVTIIIISVGHSWGGGVKTLSILVIQRPMADIVAPRLVDYS